MLFLFTPRLLLAPTKQKGNEGKEEFTKRFNLFLRGDWPTLLADTRPTAAAAPTRRRDQYSEEELKERLLEEACNRVRLGEVSRARQLLTSTGLAPGNENTLTELTDPARRPRELFKEIPQAVLDFAPTSALVLENDNLHRVLSTSRKGTAADLFGTRTEHLRVLLDAGPHWEAFRALAQAFANANVPPTVIELMAMGRMTALLKPNGQARGIVAGCVFRRLVSRAIAKQLDKVFADATAPYQFALQTRAGADALVHTLQALTDADPNKVVLSLDGIGAFDHISRAEILEALTTKPELQPLVPLVRAFYTRESLFLWTDDRGVVHEIRQSEGGEQGDPLMPALYALGQHKALQQAAANLREGENLLAFLDDLYVTCDRERARDAFRAVATEVAEVAGVQTHLGKLRAWSSGGGEAPAGLRELGQEVWTGDQPPERNGLKALGTPLGSAEYVRAHGAERVAEEQRLLDKLLDLPDLQCAWLLLLLSATPRANHLLRAVRPTLLAEYCTNHDQALWNTLAKLLNLSDAESQDWLSRNMATLPARHGGLGLRSASRTTTAAYWGSWMDSLSVLQVKQPALAEYLLEALHREPELQPAALREANDCKNRLATLGFVGLPTWHNAAAGLEAPQPTDAEMGEWRHGWQFHASCVLERNHKQNAVLPRANPQRQALLRSQSGVAAGKWLSTRPTSLALTLTPLRMQVCLRRRLHYKLPVVCRRCNGNSCRTVLDEYGHHWASCPRSGRLRRRAFPLEKTWARVFREAGARVQENVMLRDTNLEGIAANDQRCLEVVATGLPLYRGVPLGVDCTMVSPLHANGTPWARAATEDGVAIARAEHAKGAKYPELLYSNRLRLTILACETGGRWSDLTVNVVRLLAKAKARQAPEGQRGTQAAAWASRWWSLLSVASQNALASTLVDDKPLLLDGVDDFEPLWPDVLVEEAMVPDNVPID